MKKQIKYIAPILVALLAGCAMVPSGPELDKLAADIAKTSFRDQGQAKVDRLQQDDANRECAAANVAGKPIDEKLAKAIEESNLKAIKWPSDGKFLGDWKEGEKIAQSGRGMTWTDKEGSANGGNCYNCHQISKQEISFGTLGPSLYNYGKMRGVANPEAPEAKAIVEYTWGKIWNARAYNACSQMPRAGHKGILNEQQVKHIMALLLDPKSPVNQ
ncbi:MAG: sulfur oxidation c-type cytochrome SoxX [Curvibacter sp. GWA2_64_110]|nr:MAG: sulfur oxidation c-type cytochrome SoxX [Curvibacter sp. GWA2_64_110]HCY16771.1 sulfur oxidation c-type cytochrome SoxX [Curvibacter sp.]